MVCTCNTVEISGAQLKRTFGGVWNLGPMTISKDPDSNYLSLTGTKEVFEKSFISISDFKSAVLSAGVENPVMIRFSLNSDRGPYGFGDVTFDDQAVCRYKRTVIHANETIELVMEMVAKGKELNIFNGTANGESTGNKKPLFWASILKGDIH